MMANFDEIPPLRYGMTGDCLGYEGNEGGCAAASSHLTKQHVISIERSEGEIYCSEFVMVIASYLLS
jgi:hypothetical protein